MWVHTIPGIRCNNHMAGSLISSEEDDNDAGEEADVEVDAPKDDAVDEEIDDDDEDGE